MNKPKFTPGPWEVHDEDYVKSPNGYICQLFDSRDQFFQGYQMNLANARLIARAPEMHDLLYRMATHKGDDLGLFAHEAAQLIKEIDNNN